MRPETKKLKRYVEDIATGELLVGFNTAKKRTISIEVGMQNAGLATVLASTFFAAQPLSVLPCAISCAWHSISETILAGIFLNSTTKSRYHVSRACAYV